MTARITVVYILCGMYIVQVMWIYFHAGTETAAILDSTRMGTQSVYHASCDILIKMNA